MGSAEWRRRVSKGTRWALAKRRQLALVLPLDLQYLQSSGTVTEALRPFFDAAHLEGTQLTLAYEGEAGTPSHRALSAPRKALLEEYLRAGLIMRGELGRYAQTQDPDAGSRAITAMGRRTAILEKLGLENAEHEVPSLDDYLRARAAENRAGATNADDPDTSPADARKDAPRGNGGSGPGDGSWPIDTAAAPTSERDPVTAPETPPSRDMEE